MLIHQGSRQMGLWGAPASHSQKTGIILLFSIENSSNHRIFLAAERFAKEGSMKAGVPTEKRTSSGLQREEIHIEI
ncbi:MAG: hypothetical protein VX831_00845 [Candidatus Thermoplasmatota archaeon]|nr:hypothetical protein [Candidatus Thermoplasmatota archaeon]